MKKHRVIGTIFIILAIFMASLIFFSIRQNRKEDTETVESTGPTLPVAFMEVNGTDANEMFASRQTLKEQPLRDSVTPLPQDRKLTFGIHTYGMTIGDISYQITTPEDEAAVENGQITDIRKGNSELTADFSVKSDLRTGQEYTLRFTVDIGQEEPVYYYTRLVQAAGVDMSGYFSFAGNFVDMCVNKLKSDELSAYLEPDDSSANLTFTDLDITSSTDMVSWGELAPTLVKSGTPKILEVNSTTAEMSLDYIISAQDSNDQTEYYRVRDYFRMRYDTQGTVALLDFHRCSTYIFDGSHKVQTDSGIDLGVQFQDVNYRTNDDNTIAAFELNGDLWSYDISSGKVTRIFSFRDAKADPEEAVSDDRTSLTEHGITIGSVSASGDVTFAVYGYMASGSHEGRSGVSVCRYTVDSNMVEELIFIPLDQNPETLEENISRLSRVSDAGLLYLFLGTEVCSVNLDNGAYNVVKDGIPEGGFAASNSQKTIAWMNTDENGNDAGVTIMDLTGGATYQVAASSGEKIRLCGFINEDLVYGLVRSEDIVTDDAGDVTEGMYQLNIQGTDGTLKKQYTPTSGEVTAVRQESDGIELQLSERTGNTWTETSKDHIKNNELPSEAVTVSTQVYNRTGQKIFLNYPGGVTSIPDAQEIVADIRYTDAGSETIVQWPADTSKRGYYVYTGGKLTDETDHPGRAIAEADEGHGFVLTAAQRQIWVRADWPDSYTIDTTAVPAAVLTCGFDANALQQAAGDGYTVLDLTGTTQEDWFYFISRGSPVIAVGNGGKTYVIVGYDGYNVWAYDAGTKKPYAIASDDSRDEFETNGNKFLTYISN